MRLIFMGTPDFAVPTLCALVEAGHDVCAVYSQPPARAGRGKQLRLSPVHRKAEELGIEVRTPATMRDIATQADFHALEADAAVVVAYGQILPLEIINGPRLGCFNVHGSLLPRWRGAAPIQRCILAGDSLTGITTMQMETGLDTGPMLLKGKTETEDKTAGDLHDELMEMGARLMVETLARLDEIRPEKQDDREATYAAKIEKAEAAIDWTETALHIERRVRAFSPFPGAWFTLDGERVKLLRARMVGVNGAPGTVLDEQMTIACGNAAIRPVELQRAGKPAMKAEDFLRGKPAPVGAVLP
ncbi:methionyl-tRNA formyltransferase [Alteraurantiacibacter aquimixticola]|uniref:Methionyl-tRNA formyltransferase n=1 Tax=Alteraurantiacibacter aquimixticola TaxID=2489173 RepID=A0A4T3F4D5_9SPHN|nr:methionyl-tRNA formyltransferase [Alteraurantiacibacter aquimixticola]TIX52146.1 methionyl-tRNA formyltransferase [Alteraurantiacibacter aquimixticola]